MISLLVVVAALSLCNAAVISRDEHALKSTSKTWVKNAGKSVSARHRREVLSMTAEEIEEVVDYHNALRASEGADNMELMVQLRRHHHHHHHHHHYCWLQPRVYQGVVKRLSCLVLSVSAM